MKSIFLLVTILALAFFTSCDLDLEKDDTLSELEKLPPITTHGANTFGCLINGKAFVAKSSNDADAIFQKEILQINATKNAPLENISLVILKNTISSSDFFNLTDTISSYVRYNVVKENGIEWFDQETISSGHIEILLHGENKRIISGEFEFTAIKKSDTIIVSNGRFDLEYIP